MKEKEVIVLDGKEVQYELLVKPKIRYIRLRINSLGMIFLIAPNFISKKLLNDFILKRKKWILKRINNVDNLKLLNLCAKDYIKNKELARQILTQKANFFCYFYGVNYCDISIRNPKSRWGSCSSNGKLNFSFKLIFLPDYLADYVVIHEVCHLIEMNHSRKFWMLVEKQAPNYRQLRKELKKYV